MTNQPTNNDNLNNSISNSLSAAINPNHFSAHEDEGEIHKLLLKLSHDAKQKLEQGEQKLLQAKKRDQEYIDFCKRYTQTQQKLSVIFAEIQKQLGVIKRLVLSLGAKNRSLVAEIEKARQYQEQCIEELKRVLDTLRQKPLNAQLFNSGTMQTSSDSLTTSGVVQEKKNLFDFVNIESVTDLQQRAENELQEMRNIEALGMNILQQVDDQYREISQSSQKLFESSVQNEFTLPSSPRDSQEPVVQRQIVLDVNLNTTEIKAMGNLVLEIASHYDRLKHVLSNPVFSSTIDTEELEERTSKLEPYLSQLDTLLNKINTNCTYMQTKYKRFSDFYRLATSCYNESEKMAPNIPNKVVQIDELQTVFHQRRINSDVIFEEIRDLTLWYTLFQTSYGKLLHEIDRRRKVHEIHRRKIDAFNAEIHKMYEEEELSRQQFFEESGKYLPVSLCPSIMERPTKYTISPEHYSTNLPVIPLDTEEDELQLTFSGSVRDGENEHGNRRASVTSSIIVDTEHSSQRNNDTESK